MTKKPMMILLVLTLALVSIGSGYALWSDTVQARLEATTGDLAVGIRCLDSGTKGGDPCTCQEGMCLLEGVRLLADANEGEGHMGNEPPQDSPQQETLAPSEDPAASPKPCSEDQDDADGTNPAMDPNGEGAGPSPSVNHGTADTLESTAPLQAPKSEAVQPLKKADPPAISCSSGPRVCQIKGTSYHEYVDINIVGSCGRSKTLFCKLEIGNGGTIPARIKALRFDWSGKEISLNKWKAYLPNGVVKSGASLDSLQKAINSLTVDPQQTLRLELEFSQACSSSSCRVWVDYGSWNKKL